MIILNRYKVTNIKKFKRFMFLSILSISILVFTFTATFNAYSKDIPQFDLVTVQDGDTLWSIASSYAADSNTDIRELVYEISNENSIYNASIHPGDVIKVPMSVD
ncbi:MAG: LysM peptidoglycan-binding domain-containing protein [Sedimentibacter sp.]|uniref:cell division suppressor protein YneA n=1 Tax=Sedimentibacter sp. TaxID=1960295 RepID=UPI003157F44C